MAETRKFPTDVIASISSGIMLCESFAQIHEAAEFLMGHPIWTHHFADEKLVADMRAAALEQCPGLAGIEITSENWREKRAETIATLGSTQIIHKGSGLTAMLPTDGIPDGVEIIVLNTSGEQEGA